MCARNEVACVQTDPSAAPEGAGPPCCAYLLKRQLKFLKDLLKIHRLGRIWLDAGTLLGAVRGHKVIPYTNDNDLYIQWAKHPMDWEQWRRLLKTASNCTLHQVTPD